MFKCAVKVNKKPWGADRRNSGVLWKAQCCSACSAVGGVSQTGTGCRGASSGTRDTGQQCLGHGSGSTGHHTHVLAAVSSCICTLQLSPWGALCSCSLSQGHACPAATRGEVWSVAAGGDQEFWLTSDPHPEWLCFAPVCECWILDHLLPPLCEFCREWYIIYLGL